jgi:membrane fusion protein (multidrug efflux system)
MRIRFSTARIVGLALAAAFVTAPLTGLHAQDQAAAPSVIVIKAAEQEITPVTRYPGRAEAVETVQLRARVEGFIEQRNFREGADVAKGDLLFVIEQEPYKIVVDQRRAELAAAVATEKNAQADFERKKALSKRNDVSRAALDQSAAELATAEADVLHAQWRRHQKAIFEYVVGG